MGFIFDVGCVEVVGCVRGEELAHWNMVPEGVSKPFFCIDDLFTRFHRLFLDQNLYMFTHAGEAGRTD